MDGQTGSTAQPRTLSAPVKSHPHRGFMEGGKAQRETKPLWAEALCTPDTPRKAGQAEAWRANTDDASHTGDTQHKPGILPTRKSALHAKLGLENLQPEYCPAKLLGKIAGICKKTEEENKNTTHSNTHTEQRPALKPVRAK